MPFGLSHDTAKAMWEGGQMIFPVLIGIGFILAGSVRRGRALLGVAVIVLSFIAWLAVYRVAESYRPLLAFYEAR